MLMKQNVTPWLILFYYKSINVCVMNNFQTSTYAAYELVPSVLSCF